MTIDGKAIAADRIAKLKLEVAKLKTAPKLVVIIVGNDRASEMYVNMKARRASEVGINSETIKLDPTVPTEQIVRSINSLNNDPEVAGVLVQLPFPKGSPAEKNQREILDTIDPTKDVDCLTSLNMGLLALGKPRYYPATVKGILSLLEEVRGGKLDIANKHCLAGLNAVIVGRSDIVGKPLALALINLGAIVTVCNSRIVKLSGETKKADLLFSAAGVPGLIKTDMVKKGAIVIDAGVSIVDEKAVGDVEFTQVEKVAKAVTPVPGGVGPMTIVSLLENTFRAFENIEGR